MTGSDPETHDDDPMLPERHVLEAWEVPMTSPELTDRIMSRLDELPASAATGGEAGRTLPEGKGRTFPCESCGADLEFNIGQQQLRCPFCGFTKDLTPQTQVSEQDLKSTLERLVELRKSGASDLAGTQVVICDACRAEVEFTGTLTSTRCPYCGSPVQRENVHRTERGVPVDGVVPFQIDKNRAQTQLRSWVNSLWFAPNDLKKMAVTGDFQGVYLPFWSYDAMTYTRYRGERGDAYFVEGRDGKRERRVRWTPVSGEFQQFFDDLLVSAGTSLPKARLEVLEPWPLDKCLPFDEELLAGYLARTYDIPLDKGFEDARRRMEVTLRRETVGHIGGDEQRVHDIDTSYSALTYKHLLLPVWLQAYPFRGKSFQVMINAATGEVQGDRPYSAWKIFFFVLFILTVLLIVYGFSQ
ncbi:MAG: hypothetical protein KDD11_15475 [Acidobacteria bacterium]|nr:hypothetical protein [Acidobacteriota bacterium]